MRNLLLLLVFFSPLQGHNDPEFVIIIPSYNNARYVTRNLDSVIRQRQSYQQFQVIYINDASTDQTKALVDAYIAEHNMSDYVTIIHNQERRGAMRNWYDTISSLAPHKIIVCLDGDDALHGNDVLVRLSQVYRNENIWLTYGNYICVPQIAGSICAAFPKKVIKRNTYRLYSFISSHLRTFYAKLFHHIKIEDFKYEGDFVPVCCDVAMMIPMLEMCGQQHHIFIPDVLYEYTATNPISDFRKNERLINQVHHAIMARPAYKPLNNL